MRISVASTTPIVSTRLPTSMLSSLCIEEPPITVLCALYSIALPTFSFVAIPSNMFDKPTNMFKSQFEYFHNKYNILTIDIIGHGQSTDTKKGDGIDKMSEWIFDILKVENI